MKKYVLSAILLTFSCFSVYSQATGIVTLGYTIENLIVGISEPGSSHYQINPQRRDSIVASALASGIDVPDPLPSHYWSEIVHDGLPIQSGLFNVNFVADIDSQTLQFTSLRAFSVTPVVPSPITVGFNQAWIERSPNSHIITWFVTFTVTTTNQTYTGSYGGNINILEYINNAGSTGPGGPIILH